jgi:hypothetical protein
MTDIVERLRVYCLGDQLYHPLICSEAADEIECLRHDLDRHIAIASDELAEIERLRMALERISAMDPWGNRADDLGRAARVAREALGDVGEHSK